MKGKMNRKKWVMMVLATVVLIATNEIIIVPYVINPIFAEAGPPMSFVWSMFSGLLLGWYGYRWLIKQEI